MKKRIVSLLLALCLLSGNCLTVFADETKPASQESTVETVTTETQEQTQSKSQPTLEPQNDPEMPALTQDALSIDMDRQYPGMDKTYRTGYSGTVAEGKLRLVLPLLNQGGMSTPINVTLSAAFLTAEEKKEFLISQNMNLGNGQTVENVYLADFEIALPDSVTPGSYPVKVTVDIGDTAQAIELPQTVEKVSKKRCHCEPARRLVWQSPK